MSNTGMDPALAAKQAQDAELVQLKTQVDRLRGDLTPGPSKQKKLRKACTDFEAVFISKLWEQMRATIPKGGYLQSPQQDMYRSMFDRDFAEKLANDGGIGLGDMLYGQLKDRLKGAGAGVAPDGTAAIKPGPAAARALAPAPAPADAGEAAAQTAPLGKRALKPLPQRSEAPARPAAVPGDVMADVEALARRIEDDFDRRTQAAGRYPQAQKTAAGSPAPGRKLAVIG